MGIPSRTIKGLHDIRSHSGRAREEATPHKAYMRLSCLEMEKFRRAKERESALARVRNIDTRFREINSEEEAILLAGGLLPGGAVGLPSMAASAQRDPGGTPASSEGLRFRY